MNQNVLGLPTAAIDAAQTVTEGNKAFLLTDEYARSLGIATVDIKKVLNNTGVEYMRRSLTMSTGFCFHQCQYCYLTAPYLNACNKNIWDGDFAQPKVVSNMLAKLDEELLHVRKKYPVLLSFAGEPFPYGDTPEKKFFQNLSIEALKKLNAAGIAGVVLTKGTIPIELAECTPSDPKKSNWYGISLVNLRHNEEYHKEYEPNSATSADRLAALKALKAKAPKAKFWISMEPYPVPSMIEGMDEAGMKKELEYILSQLTWVDKVVFGRGNRNELFTQYDGNADYYVRMAEVVKAWGKANNVGVYIKRAVYGLGKKDSNGKIVKVDLFD